MNKKKIEKEINEIKTELKALTNKEYKDKRTKERINYLTYKINIYKMYLNMIKRVIKEVGNEY